MKSRIIILVLVLVSSSGPLLTQDQPSTHEQAVRELFQLLGLERTMVGGASAMIDAQVQANAALTPYRDVMLEWAQTFLTWEAMGPRLVKVQMEAFTESEVREMIAFYKTPTGQKALLKMPELMKQGAAIGVEVAKAHQPELEKMILERKRQLESNEGKP